MPLMCHIILTHGIIFPLSSVRMYGCHLPSPALHKYDSTTSQLCCYVTVLSLRQILANDQSRGSFKEFLAEEYAAENLLFWQDVELFRLIDPTAGCGSKASAANHQGGAGVCIPASSKRTASGSNTHRHKSSGLGARTTSYRESFMEDVTLHAKMDMHGGGYVVGGDSDSGSGGNDGGGGGDVEVGASVSVPRAAVTRAVQSQLNAVGMAIYLQYIKDQSDFMVNISSKQQELITEAVEGKNISLDTYRVSYEK